MIGRPLPVAPEPYVYVLNMPPAINTLELLLGLATSSLIATLGYWRNALSLSGLAGAIATGTLILGVGGWEWGILLIAFFLSSSALSSYRATDKRMLAEKFAKGSRRDFGQTLANGGIPALLAVLSAFHPSDLWYLACAGAISAVNADTWATEIGVLGPGKPRLITNCRVVDIGTSGGVTYLGTAASFAGATTIGLLAGLPLVLTGHRMLTATPIVLSATLGGLCGSLVDSLLGATIQCIYWCDTCCKDTERKVHRCGSQTRRLRGLRWLGNDVVNLLASATGATVAAALGFALTRR
jgi:uncharacterized protein (TIGR00297 family)